MESVMKKVLSVLIMGLLIIMSSIPVCADMGAPSEPEYTAVLKIEGVPFYIDYEDYQNGKSSGTLTGGQAFYVWDTFDEILRGTTDPNAGPDQFLDFVYIYNGDIVSAADMVSPAVGTEVASTTATTTDALNLRYGPGTGFKIIKTLNKDTEVTYDHTYKTDTTWMYVNAGGASGWVSGDYLKTKTVAAADKKTESEDESKLTPVQEPDTTGSLQRNEGAVVEDKRRFIAGIICICAGVAILITVLAAYLLNRRNA